jgi:hypothetical protein
LVGVIWYVAGARPKSQQRLIPEFIHEEDVSWYEANQAHWRSGAFVGLDDQSALRTLCTKSVAARFEGPDIDARGLEADLCEFLHALGGPSLDDYIRRVTRFRRLKTEVASDEALYKWYRDVTGDAPSRSVSVHEAALAFRKGIPGAPQAPVAVSERAWLQVSWTKPIPDAALGSAWSYAWPEFTMFRHPEAGRWVGSYSQGVPRISEPMRDFDEDIRANGRVLVCHVMVAVKTADDQVFPISLTMHLSPADKKWHVSRFGHACPKTWSWPL